MWLIGLSWEGQNICRCGSHAFIYIQKPDAETGRPVCNECIPVSAIGDVYRFITDWTEMMERTLTNSQKYGKIEE